VGFVGLILFSKFFPSSPSGNGEGREGGGPGGEKHKARKKILGENRCKLKDGRGL
jgi:hypothetical protein